MHRFARFVVAGALLAGTAVFLPTSPGSAAPTAPLNTCTGGVNTGTADDTVTTGLVLVAKRDFNLQTSSGPLTCTGPLAYGANFSVNFTGGGWNAVNCDTIMQKSSATNGTFRMNWTDPIGSGFTTGTAQAKVTARDNAGTTLSVTGKFSGTAGRLYMFRPFTATIRLDQSFKAVGTGGDCAVTGNGLETFTTTVTAFTIN